MTTASFYDRKAMNPRALTVVVLLHGAALTALILAKGEDIKKIVDPPIFVDSFEDDKPPPPNPEPRPHPDVKVESHVTVTKPAVDTRDGPTFEREVFPPPQPGVLQGIDPIVQEPPQPPPPPPPPPPEHKVEPARARANLASYVSDADYPTAAIRSEEQGTTRFRLAVGPDGKVSECVVTGSSGSSSLDAATCRIMKARARFTAAHDGTGNPTSDTVASAIKWVLPEG
jgi:periplasmic protein TonB